MLAFYVYRIKGTQNNKPGSSHEAWVPPILLFCCAFFFGLPGKPEVCAAAVGNRNASGLIYNDKPKMVEGTEPKGSDGLSQANHSAAAIHLNTLTIRYR